MSHEENRKLQARLIELANKATGLALQLDSLSSDLIEMMLDLQARDVPDPADTVTVHTAMDVTIN